MSQKNWPIIEKMERKTVKSATELKTEVRKKYNLCSILNRLKIKHIY